VHLRHELDRLGAGALLGVDREREPRHVEGRPLASIGGEGRADKGSLTSRLP